MERLPTKTLENAIKVYETTLKIMGDDYEYCNGVLDKVTVGFLKELKEYRDTEEQGLLVRVECRCKDCVHWSDMVAGATEHVKLCTIGGYMVGENGYCSYGEKKLKGEENE